jgi:hypothetical protein
MSEPFVPYKPEQTVKCEITKREAVLLQKIRKYSFGQFVVFKANDLIVRVEIRDSQLVEEKERIELTIVE